MGSVIPAKDVAVRDWSPDYGTVKSVNKQNEDYVEITFVNGTVITPGVDTEIFMEQGGRF